MIERRQIDGKRTDKVAPPKNREQRPLFNIKLTKPGEMTGFKIHLRFFYSSDFM